tara:strand:- start:1224 stop:1664 length:441 start_codon:yes stop_codon:yes gene_type:complete
LKGSDSADEGSPLVNVVTMAPDLPRVLHGSHYLVSEPSLGLETVTSGVLCTEQVLEIHVVSGEGVGPTEVSRQNCCSVDGYQPTRDVELHSPSSLLVGSVIRVCSDNAGAVIANLVPNRGVGAVPGSRREEWEPYKWSRTFSTQLG